MVSLELFRSEKFCFAAFSLIFVPSIPFSVLVSGGYDNTILSDTIPGILILFLVLGIVSVSLHLFSLKLKFRGLDLFRALFFLTALVGAIFAGTGAVHPDEYATLGKIGNGLAIFGLIGGELSGFVKELKEENGTVGHQQLDQQDDQNNVLLSTLPGNNGNNNSNSDLNLHRSSTQ